MKLLKVENHSYQIIYVNDNEKYNVYRRLNENKWEIFRRDQWRTLDDFVELEKMFNEHDLKS